VVKLYPRKTRVTGRATALFSPVHLQFHILFEEPGDRVHYAFAATPAANVDVAVVCVSAEAVVPLFQLLVEVIQEDVGEQRR
jgi:hypothetical protein